MAYVRRRGNQLAIVQGKRRRATGKVQQKILFTIYSRAEALETLGRREKGGAERFRHLLEYEHPEIKFNWKTIRHAIAENLDFLPDSYDYRSQRIRSRFRGDLCAFTRRLILTDPQNLLPAAQIIEEHRHELEYLAELITWRVKLRDQKESEWNADNPFYWRFSLQGSDVPPDTEEHAAEFYERGDYERAAPIFRLLVDCFDRYAEGYNYLGLIALEQGKPDEAVEHFEKTVQLSAPGTRPNGRGLRNLALSLNQANRFGEALAACDRLVDEYDDGITAFWHRATVYLNTRMWEQAADAAQRVMSDQPAAGFIAGFALFELGKPDDMLRVFLYSALNHPRAAQMLAETDIGEELPPTSYDEAKDHDTGISLLRGLHAYFKGQSRRSKRFFRRVMSDFRVVALLEEILAVVRRRHEQGPTGELEAFNRMQLMHSLEFAGIAAQNMLDLLNS